MYILASFAKVTNLYIQKKITWFDCNHNRVSVKTNQITIQTLEGYFNHTGGNGIVLEFRSFSNN